MIMHIFASKQVHSKSGLFLDFLIVKWGDWGGRQLLEIIAKSISREMGGKRGL